VIGKRADQHRVDHCEKGGIGPDAQAEGQKRGSRESLVPDKRPERDSKVMPIRHMQGHGPQITLPNAKSYRQGSPRAEPAGQARARCYLISSETALPGPPSEAPRGNALASKSPARSIPWTNPSVNAFCLKRAPMAAATSDQKESPHFSC